MLFREFADVDRTTDPKLVESLCYHAVNGTRLRSSVSFLENEQSQWFVKLLSVSLEATRILTWHWLGCIGASLQVGERPPLYKLLDPRESVVVQALQHYGSLLMSLSGRGRLVFLWPCRRFPDFATFCGAEPEKCRSIRRILMLGAGWVFRRHFVYLNSDQFAVTLGGDEQADPHTLRNFLDFYDAKHWCCFPPGLCRDLKQQDLTSVDLTSGNCRKLLHWVASTLQLSIADVESLHSQNRALQGSRFSSIAAKFVNAESKRLQDEAVKLQLGKSQEQHPSTSSSAEKGIKICTKTITPKGLSPLELFRKHFLELRSRGETLNPCNKQVWQEVRDAWSQLTPGERELYQQMSETSKADALAKRKRIKDQNKNNVQSNQGRPTVPLPQSEETAALVPHEESRGVHLQTVSVSDLGSILDSASQDGLEKIFECSKPSCPKKPSESLAKTGHPLSERTLDEVWRSQVRSGTSGKSAFQSFKKQSESIARPHDADDIFPNRVVHEGYCGEQCRHFGETLRIALHCNTLDMFNFIVSQSFGIETYVMFDVDS